MNKLKLFICYVLCLVVIINGINCQQEIPADEKYRIIYNVLYEAETNNYEIFSMNIDGSDKRNISNSPGIEWVYYAYKNKIYFISDRGTCSRCYFLYVMDPEGNNVNKIANIQLADSWMDSRRNGTELIVRPANYIDTSFFIISSENGSLISKIKPDLKYFTDPLFIPNNDKIVFRGSYSAFKEDRTSVDELFIINTDGRGLKQLTTYPKDDTTAEWYSYHAGPPQWKPDENFISYQSKQNGKYSLYAITPDGKKQWKLHENEQNEGWHSWSSDGKWLTVELFDDDQTQFNIGLMNWETKEMKILTDTTYKFQQAPVFVEN